METSNCDVVHHGLGSLLISFIWQLDGAVNGRFFGVFGLQNDWRQDCNYGAYRRSQADFIEAAHIFTPLRLLALARSAWRL
jgi:hypothetical protein